MANLTTNEVIALFKKNVVANPDGGQDGVLTSILINGKKYEVGAKEGFVTGVTIKADKEVTIREATPVIKFNPNNFIISADNTITLNQVPVSNLDQDADLILNCEGATRTEMNKINMEAK